MKKKNSLNKVTAIVNEKGESYMRCEINGVVTEARGSSEAVYAKFKEALSKAFGPPAIEGKVRGK